MGVYFSMENETSSEVFCFDTLSFFQARWYTMYDMKNIHTKALFYSGTLFLLVLSVLAISATVFVIRDARGENRQNTISVSGTSEILAEPDIARFSFEVKEMAKNPKEGQDVISEKTSKILGGLKDLGVETKDIKTESYTIHPKYEWVKVIDRSSKVALSGERYIPNHHSKRVQVGFDVSQRIRVALRDLKKAPDALMLFAGVGVENLSGPHFDIENIDELKMQARLKAVAIAKDKAKRLAQDLDVKLVKIVSFDESRGGGTMPINRHFAMKGIDLESADMNAAVPELPQGENEVRSTVTLRYKIK